MCTLSLPTFHQSMAEPTMMDMDTTSTTANMGTMSTQLIQTDLKEADR
jgi:hypothetical protein